MKLAWPSQRSAVFPSVCFLQTQQKRFLWPAGPKQWATGTCRGQWQHAVNTTGAKCKTHDTMLLMEKCPSREHKCKCIVLKKKKHFYLRPSEYFYTGVLLLRGSEILFLRRRARFFVHILFSRGWMTLRGAEHTVTDFVFNNFTVPVSTKCIYRGLLWFDVNAVSKPWIGQQHEPLVKQHDMLCNIRTC